MKGVERQGFHIVLGRMPDDHAEVTVIQKLFTEDECGNARSMADKLRHSGMEAIVKRVPMPRKGWE